MHEALCRSSGTTLDILHAERRAADHSANIGSKPDSRDSFAEAISLFERALALDPQSVEAQTCLAGSLAGLRVFYGTSDLVAADLARADALISRALAVAPRYAFAHYVKGQVLRAQNRWEEAVIEYETALASNPNLVAALHGLGWCKLFAGRLMR